MASAISGRYSEPDDTVTPGTFTWAVYMSSTSSQFSATMISKKFLITSAHAMDEFHNDDCLSAYFMNALHPFSVKVKRFLLYPDFDVSRTQAQENDFAIMELEQSSTLDQQHFVFPIIDRHQYDSAELRSIAPVFAIGYAGSRIARLVELIWPQRNPEKLYRLSYNGTAQHGDSGGPLFYSQNSSYYLLGIHDSSGSTPGNWLSFEPVAKYLDFIHHNTDIRLKDEEPANSMAYWNPVNCTADPTIYYIIGTASVFSILFSTAVLIGYIVIVRKLVMGGRGRIRESQGFGQEQ